MSHFLEKEGIPTTGISLVRPHTETIKPPRALWVPFEFGCPLGVPDDVAFQRRVLLALLKLLEAPEGPILEDFPEDAPEVNGNTTVLSCPVYYGKNEAEPGETDPLQTAFLREIKAMRPWYNTAVSKRNRTTVGASRIELDKLGDFLYTFVKGDEPENPRDDISLGFIMKLAVEDLKAYYIEGVTTQPGQSSASSQILKDWFWGETVAGRVLLKLKKTCEASTNTIISSYARFLVPGDVAQRYKE